MTKLTKMNNLSDLKSLSIGIEDLPVEFFHFYLFKYLDLHDILLNLRLVSRRLNSIVKSYPIRELSFYKNDYFKDIWFSTSKSNNFKDLFHFSKLFLLKTLSDNFLNLKYLRSLDSNFSQFKIDILNKFTKLQVLELYQLNMDSNGFLQLNDLKAFAVNFVVKMYAVDFKIIADLPSLYYLNIINYRQLSSKHNCSTIDNKIKFKHPLSIKHLQISSFEKSTKILSDLECLDVTFRMQDIMDLLDFKNLNKIRFYSSDRIHEIKKLAKSHKKNWNLVLAGVRINKITDFYAFKNRNDVKFQLINYNDLEDGQNIVRFFSYDSFLDIMKNKLPDQGFFRKFNNIHELKIEENVDDENRLVNFIKNCSNLCILILLPPLSQRFYDQLPDVSLHILYIKRHYSYDLNFEFLKKMPYLKKPKSTSLVLDIKKQWKIAPFEVPKFGGLLYQDKAKIFGLKYFNENGYIFRE